MEEWEHDNQNEDKKTGQPHFRVLLPVFLCGILLLAAPAASADTVKVYGDNLVFSNGTMDGILADGETEKTLNGDWGVSYPVATFGGEGADSPAKIRNIDGNNILVLEYSTGNFASFFADLYADGTWLPAGTYRLSMDLKPVDDFTTDNVGFNLYNQYSDVRIYDSGWKNCTEGEDGWLHYEAEFTINADSVDSIQMWFNTMGTSTLYVDNLSLCAVTEQEVIQPDDSNAKTADGSRILLAGVVGLSAAAAACTLCLNKKRSETV